MHRISQLMSTPVANKYSSRSDSERDRELSPECLFARFACDFLDGDSSFECCSIDPLTGCHHACRRSPRLLTNGYYIWTEDSFLCDSDGNITLNPSQTSVMYKENLVRVFRKKKRIRHTLSSFFNPRASKSWLDGSIFDDINSSPNEESWLEDVRRPDIHHHNENEPCLIREASFQAVLLALCFIICACARWLLGGVLANVFTCASMITTAYIVRSLLFSFGSYFRATTYTRLDLPKFENH
ncbi:PREDICTED: transmembrane protein 71 isoform X8 [Dipodomys ordii]|uniref:Transmembrane protein 71 isoform X8 n=1 Tax=Dipodomys ordii TaxID=10020 RepID=A0A1S3FVN1_DIPOR|nr:PREDICTED: transmembrane protein 71 isoform X8 [Dipodomys ordii]